MNRNDEQSLSIIARMQELRMVNFALSQRIAPAGHHEAGVAGGTGHTTGAELKADRLGGAHRGGSH